MLKPVCVKCQRFYRMEQQSFYFIEGMPIYSNALPGTLEPEKWRPYKLWTSDKWKCKGCGHEILSGFGLRPIAEHYEPNFKAKVESFDATFQVNDC